MHEGLNTKILEKWRNAQEGDRGRFAPRPKVFQFRSRADRREREIPVDYLSRDQLCPRNDVIGTIMLKKEVVSAVSNFRPADIDEDRRRNSQFSPYTMLERAVIGGEEA